MQMQRIAIAVTAVLVFASLGGAAAIAAFLDFLHCEPRPLVRPGRHRNRL